MSTPGDTRDQSIDRLPFVNDAPWQMSFGERAALEGLLAQLRPELALEIGTAEGGSLSRIAAHSGEVHSIDLVPPQLPVADEPHVRLHGGDSRERLPALLAEFAANGRNVDFVLIDGDHSADGVRADLEDVLASDAVRETVIVLHDTINEEVRRGIESVDFSAHAKIRLVDLDFVPGAVSIVTEYRGQLWGGLGVIVCTREALPVTGGSSMIEVCVPPGSLALGALALSGRDVERDTDFVALAAQQATSMPAEPPAPPAPPADQIPWRTVLAALRTFPRRAIRRLRGKRAA